jgi:nucleoside-diphosphate-sugar epimerase
MAEMEVWRGIGEGLDAVVANPGVILGPGNWDTGSAQLMKLAHKEFPFYTQGVTSWVGADDVVNALVMLMNADISGERYIISAGNYPYRDIFTMMAKALDKRPPRYKANNLMTGIVWRLSTLRNKLTGSNMLITKETATTAGSHAHFNNTKFLSAFPVFAYEPMEDTIARMARSFRNN